MAAGGGNGWPLPPEVEEAEYCRSLLETEELAQLKADIARDGPLPIAGVRALIAQNSVKETQNARGDNCILDPELLMLLDVRIDYPVFVAGDNAFAREDIYAHYALDAFGQTPESLFAQQEIGVFPAKSSALDAATQREYVARDVGDPEEFVMVEDLVGRATRPGYGEARAPLRVVKTKVFLGKDRWEDFSMMARFVRGFRDFIAPLMDAPGGEGPFRALRPLLALCAPPSSLPAPGPPAEAPAGTPPAAP